MIIKSQSFHDYSIESLEYNWKENVAQLKIRGMNLNSNSIENKVLSFSIVREININQKNPWGPSQYILETQFLEKSFEILMQSGDKITILAEHIEIQ